MMFVQMLASLSHTPGTPPAPPRINSRAPTALGGGPSHLVPPRVLADGPAGTRALSGLQELSDTLLREMRSAEPQVLWGVENWAEMVGARGLDQPSSLYSVPLKRTLSLWVGRFRWVAELRRSMHSPT